MSFDIFCQNLGRRYDERYFLCSHRLYLDKQISLRLNKGRKVSGTLRGYDQFMNLVLGDAVEELNDDAINKIGMVVS